MTRLQDLLAPATRLLDIASRYNRSKGSPSCPLHRGEDFCPFFIIGSGRCGTTLLRRILMAHDDVYIPPETYALGPSVLDFKACADLPWTLICRIVLSSFAFSEDFASFPVKSLRPCLARLGKTAKDERSLAVIIDRFYRYLAAHAKPRCEIWGDKTPLNSFYLDEIDAVFPRARYLHMIRDGCDVIYSYLETGRYSDIQKAADRWTRSVTLCQTFGKERQDRFIEISYEGMITDPEATIEQICAFIGVSFDKEMIGKIPEQRLGDVETKRHHSNVMRPINKESVGKGRVGLTAEQRQILHERISNRLRSLGYPPVIGQ